MFVVEDLRCRILGDESILECILKSDCNLFLVFYNGVVLIFFYLLFLLSFRISYWESENSIFVLDCLIYRILILGS